MLNVIMYSFDRACQLDLALRSIKDHFVEWQDQLWTVIVKYSNEEYKKGYERVFELHPEFLYVIETDFRQDTVDAFNRGLDRPLMTWMMDDDVFIRPFSLNDGPVKEFLANPDVTTMSCRMAPYMNHCYTQNKPAPPPKSFINREDYIIWDWKNMGIASDWGYPMSIACFHLFRTSQIAPLVQYGKFKAPNSLEGMLASRPLPGTNMTCYKAARNLNVPVNKVQVENDNRRGSLTELQQDALNKAFLEGKRIDPASVYNAVTPSPHFEMQLTLE